jgi:hypothetical protein
MESPRYRLVRLNGYPLPRKRRGLKQVELGLGGGQNVVLNRSTAPAANSNPLLATFGGVASAAPNRHSAKCPTNIYSCI